MLILLALFPILAVRGTEPLDSKDPEKSLIADISLCNWSIDGKIDNRVLIDSTKAIVLVDFNEKILSKNDLEGLSGLVIIGNLQLPGSCRLLSEKLAPLYLNKPLTMAHIKEIKKTIQAFFLEHNYPFTTVTVPCQSLSSNVLQLIVCQSKLNHIAIEGNKYTKTEHLKRLISVQPGERIRSSSVQKDLAFINRNPYRHANAIYAAGKEPCTTDLIIPVDERKPWRVYGGADNQGVPTIRRQRIFTGVGFNFYLGCDHNFNFQYTTAYVPKTFQSYTGQWMLFLPWKNILNFYGGYSTVQAIASFPEKSNRGVFIQASGRYTVPNLIGLRYPIEFTVGFDFKRTNTSLLFSELFTNTASIANLSQFVCDARWNYEGDISRIELVGEIYYSPGQLLGDETLAQYNGLRPGATPNYVYGKGAIRYTQWLPSDFELILWMRGQLASAPLLPSEQYGLGGFDTVRGYDEYQLNMDNAFNLNFEIRSPGIEIIRYIRKFKVKDSLQFLAFIDYGIGRNKFPLPGEASPSWLLGVGPGARYTLDPNIALRIDWGWKLKKVPNTPPGGGVVVPYSGGPSMVQFSATLSY